MGGSVGATGNLLEDFRITGEYLNLIHFFRGGPDVCSIFQFEGIVGSENKAVE